MANPPAPKPFKTITVPDVGLSRVQANTKDTLDSLVACIIDLQKRVISGSLP